MKITTQHLHFYQACKTPTPSWVRLIKKTPWNLTPEKADCINELINTQDETLRKALMKTYRTSNFLNVLKTVRKTTPLRAYLSREPFEEESNKRLAKKYLQRMQPKQEG